MAYEAPDMVNNVAWFRPAGFSPFASGAGSAGGSGGTHGRSASIAQEWNEYAANAKGAGAGAGAGQGQGKREDWMVCAAGRELRALRVA